MTTFRSVHAVNEEHEIAKFSLKTATGPLCYHLIEHHLNDWVSQCDAQGIEIHAQDAQDAIENYRKSCDQTGFQATQLPYTKSNFVDALVEFIVGDDQVCI